MTDERYEVCESCSEKYHGEGDIDNYIREIVTETETITHCIRKRCVSWAKARALVLRNQSKGGLTRDR